MKPLRHLLSVVAGCLGLSALAAAAETSPRPPSERQPLHVMLSAGDSWWFGTWLPVDSAGSIRDSVQMWSDVLNMKRIYWRGE
jgi:hypothetical protein